METLELIKRISNGEDSYTQFKENINNSNKLAEELVAFSNSKGGLLIIGVSDYNEIIGINDDDIRRLNELIGNVINVNIKPPIYPMTEIKTIRNKKLLVIEVESGSNKPYSTNKGIYLTKAGSDKRKISPEELRRLFAESKRLYTDEEAIINTSINDLNMDKYNNFLQQNNKEVWSKLKKEELDLNIILENDKVMKNNQLTLAGNLIFGNTPQVFKPSFYIDCCYFDGNDISVNKFISKKTIKGTFYALYEESIRFLISGLRSYQSEDNFNSNGELEIQEDILIELIINALVHRDYYINSSIKVFIFNNRVEIISPGKLTNSLTVENIKNGISVHRNPILNSICKNILPYSGYGSGIKRSLSLNPNIEFKNDTDKEEFKCVIPRIIM